jgi:hypothetical protein
MCHPLGIFPRGFCIDGHRGLPETILDGLATPPNNLGKMGSNENLLIFPGSP